MADGTARAAETGRQRWQCEIVDERMAAYGIAAKVAFDGLRAQIGQLSGLLILAQARLRQDLPDLPEVAVARAQSQSAIAQLARLDPPAGRGAVHATLLAASAHLDHAIAGIAAMRRGQTDATIDAVARRLGTAYALLQRACDHRIGLAMVDMGAACCSCGKAFEQPLAGPSIEGGGEWGNIRSGFSNTAM